MYVLFIHVSTAIVHFDLTFSRPISD